MLAEALAHAAPGPVADGIVTLLVSGSDVHLDGLERRRSVLEEEIGAALGTKVKVEFKPAAPGQPAAAPPAPAAPVAPKAAPVPALPAASTAPTPAPQESPRRLDQQGEREERLKTQRARDRGLDAVADALDLELIE
jgi:hypothetical protein